MRFLKLSLLLLLVAFCLPAHATNYTTSPLLSTYTADDVGNLTLTGRDNWDTQLANTPSLTIDGSSSGATVLKSAATASGTLTIPAATDTLVARATTDTLTNKTLTSPTITGATQSGTINSDIKFTTAPVTKNTSAVLANVTGLETTVVPGTYRFHCVLPSTVASGTGGIQYAFNYTTTALTSIEATGVGYTASAVAVQHTTTTTTQTALFSQAAVVIMTVIDGTMVVATGGTIDLQVAQNTSNASNTVALLGGSMEFTRIQ